jgi:hypothetical protein
MSTVAKETEEKKLKVVVVTIPEYYNESRESTFIKTVEAQFEGTGVKVVFIPDESRVTVIG